MNSSHTEFHWEQAGVLAVSDEAGDVRWLETFLRPWFASEPSTEVGGASPTADLHRVELVHDDDRFARLEHRHDEHGTTGGASPDRPPPGRAPCFALDDDVVCLPTWEDGGRRVLRDGPLGAFYLLDGRSITVLGRVGDLRPRFSMARIIREVTRGLLKATPWAALHAAGAVIDGDGVVIAGPKRSGKTTLLAYLLSMSGARLVANDCVMVAPSHDGTQSPRSAHSMRGVPTVVRVRPGTAALVPAPGLPADCPSFLVEPGDDPALIASLAPSPTEPGIRHRRPSDFAADLGAGTQATAPMSVLLFPDRDAGPSEAVAWPLTEDEAVARLSAARYGSGAGDHEPTVFGGAPSPMDDRQLRRLARDVPALAVSMREHAFTDVEAAHAIVEAVHEVQRQPTR